MKYSFTLHRGAEREKLVLESRAGESDRHIALKLLAYLLFREETGGPPLRIEQGVGQRHKPDLVATEPGTDRVLLWVDCGQIETQRLARIVERNPRARVFIVKSTDREALLYARAAVRRLTAAAISERRAVVTFVSFAGEFLSDFLHRLRGTNTLTVIAQDAERLTFLLNGEALTAEVTRLPADCVQAADS